MFKKIIALAIALVMAVACFASCAGNTGNKTNEDDPLLPIGEIKKDFDVPADFKIGVICLHDENSTYDKNFIDAVKDVASALGLKDDQLLLETGIDESDACYNKAKDFAEKGCKIVFADSFGHEPFMAQAAKEYPNVQFCHATGVTATHTNNDLPNFHNAFAAIYEGRYLAGIAAGLKLNEMIAAGKITAEQAIIGYVGAFTYAEVVSGMTSFYLGARSVCPSATMKVRYTGSWYDPGKEQEAATALIEQDKCVLISQHADSLGAPTACETHNVPNVSYNGSTYNAGKNTYIVSSAINWRPYFYMIIKAVCEGKSFDKEYVGTIATGSVVLFGLNRNVAAEGTAAAIQTAIDGFKAGTLHVFDVSKFTVTVTETSNTNATVDGEGHLTAYLADVDGDNTGETNVIHDGYFDESGAGFRSAPYFDIIIDGVTNLNVDFG